MILPELLKRVNEDITNLVFGVLLIAIMILWQGRSQGLLADSCGAGGPAGGRDDAAPPGAGGVGGRWLFSASRTCPSASAGSTPCKDVTFAVHQGQIKALIGPNGAGKTTLFNLASGSYRPTQGRVLFSGVDVTGKAPHRICRMGLGRTFQHSLVFDDMSVVENVAVGRYSRTKAGVAVGGAHACRCTGGRSGRPSRPRTRRCAGWAWTTGPTSRPRTCPWASGTCSRSPGRWRRSRSCCCWTSRRPG